MSEEWENIDIFEGLMNLFALPIYIIGFVFTLYIFLNKKTTSRGILALLMLGGCLFSIGEILEVFFSEEYLDTLDQLGDAFNIFLASILLILGFIVILEQKVMVSEQKFKHLFENSPHSVLLLELSGTITNCNIATSELFGHKKDYLLGKQLSNFFLEPSKLSISIEERIKTIKKSKILEPLELQLIQNNNIFIWVSLQTSIFSLDNEIFLQVVLQDITEKKKAENLIIEEVKKLKEIDQIRSDFIRRTSHELKTPLTSIYSTSQYLLDNFDKEGNEEMLNLIKSINRGGKRLKKLSEDLLDVFDLESKILSLKKQNFDLVTIIKEIVDDFALSLKERSLFLKLDLINSCFIFADKIRIEQIISNLFSNAIKNTPPNGLIFISLKKKIGFIELLFKDTGVGFTEEEKANVFEKFGKIERKNINKNINIEGSGLGLYISKQIVDLHNGIISLESDGRYKGSTFTIKLPIKDEN